MDSRPSTGSLGGPLNPDDMDDVLFTTAWVAEGGWTFGWQRDLPIPSDGTKPEPMTSDIILAIEIAGRELSISLLGPHKAVTDTSAAAPQPSPQDLADSATDSTPDAGAEGGGGLGGSGPKVFEDEETSEE